MALKVGSAKIDLIGTNVDTKDIVTTQTTFTVTSLPPMHTGSNYAIESKSYFPIRFIFFHSGQSH